MRTDDDFECIQPYLTFTLALSICYWIARFQALYRKTEILLSFVLLHVVVFAYSMYLRVRTDEFECSQFDFTNTTWPHLYLSRACVCGCCTGKNVRKALFGFGFFVASNACAEIHIEDLHWKSSYNRTRETRFSLSVVLNAAAAGTKTVKCFGKRCFGMGFMLCTENTLYDHIAAEQEKEKNRTGEIKGKESEWMRKRDRKQ